MKTTENVKVLLLSIYDSLDVLKSYALNSVPRPTDNIEDFHKWRDSELAYVHIYTTAVIRCRQKPSFSSLIELKVIEEKLRLKALQSKDKLKAWSNEVVAAAITLHNAQKKANDKKKSDAVLSGQKPTETVKPEAKPIVTFSSDFLTVNCNVWKKSESRERKRQANTMLRKLYKNYKRGNKPIPVEKILKGISTERIEKLLNKTRYPQTFSLICQKTEEKTGKRTISLSDDYEYRAE